MSGTVVISYKFRLLPTRAQHRVLEGILEAQRQLYNAALAERIDCYQKTGKGRTYFDQCKALTEWRRFDEAARAAPPNLHRWTLARLNDSYQAFFRRIKANKGKAGFPRFRGKGWWRSFGFAEFSGIRFDGKRLRFATMPGGLRAHLHRALPEGKPLSCAFTKDAKGWTISFQMRVEVHDPRSLKTATGIDLGLSSLATLSDGTAIPNPHHAKRAERESRLRQRALSRCKYGSNRRDKIKQRVARIHRKVADTRATSLHQISADLVNRFDLIAMEKLNVKGMASGMFAKPIHDASWGMLRKFIAYKAEKAGCTMIEVDPRYTSQTCPDCGQVVPKPLSQRTHKCNCGCVMDRDHAAARVILDKGVLALGALNVAGCSERVPGNLSLEGISGQSRYQRNWCDANKDINSWTPAK